MESHKPETQLLCDIGNTSIKLGIAESGAIKQHFAFPTRHDATADSLGLEMKAALDYAQAGNASICLAVSVVPRLRQVLRAAMARYAGCETIFAPENLPVPMENRYERPAEVGADRLVGAYAARHAFSDPPSIIVVDFGTAVTFDCIKENAYMGGLIFPGPMTTASALASHTARLPQVSLDVEAAEPGPCKDTATSISHGIAFGYASLVEGLCGRLAAQMPKPVKIVATGGFAPAIGRLVSVFDEIMPELLLDGLLWLYIEKNKNIANS